MNAVTWGGAIFQFANTVGPAVGGLLFTLTLPSLSRAGLEGAGIVYLFTLCSLILFLVLVGRLTFVRGAWSIVPHPSRWCWPAFATC